VARQDGYRDDAQSLVVFVSHISEHRHVVSRRDFYSGSVAGVVPELRRAGNRGEKGCVGSDNTTEDGDVNVGHDMLDSIALDASQSSFAVREQLASAASSGSREVLGCVAAS
jgi:hypothetical protein